jgi:K+-transporting ATPase A subunit
MKKILTLVLALLTSVNLFAQDYSIEMADKLRADGKIYIVVISILIILVGLLIYLFKLDRRLKMLEKKSADKN